MLRMLSKESREYKKWKEIFKFHVENPQPRSDFRDTFKSCSEDCCSLLGDMLQLDDRARATAAQCFRSHSCRPCAASANTRVAGTPSSSQILR
jgi:hypothetical protein